MAKRGGTRGGSHRTAPVPPPPPRLPRVLLLLACAVAAAVAWWVLVRAAIERGRAAQDGGGTADWVLLGLATFGAVLCLLVALLALVRAWAVGTGRVVPAAPAPAGRRKR